MSVVRFVHADALRLGSPINGLSDSPDWLRKTAASAVRTAVTNTIEVAIAGRCQFVLIAGRLCESTQDLDLSVGWLRSQVAGLKDHGIQLVIAGHPTSEFPSLAGLDAILVAPGQRLDVRPSQLDRPELTVSSAQAAARPGSLGIEVSLTAHARPLADLAYTAVPAVTPSTHNSADGTTTAHDRLLRLSAGSPQAIQPTERGTFGCQLVEADFDRNTLTARFCPTDLIRYSQVLLNCLPGTSIERVCDLLRDRSRTIAAAGRCTTVVEWVIDGDIVWPAARREPFNEVDLLRELRGSLNAGHSGAWPGRIRFSDTCLVDVPGDSPAAARELAAVQSDRWQRSASDSLRSNKSPRIGSDILTSLSLLRRVA